MCRRLNPNEAQGVLSASFPRVPSASPHRNDEACSSPGGMEKAEVPAFGKLKGFTRPKLHVVLYEIGESERAVRDVQTRSFLDLIDGS